MLAEQICSQQYTGFEICSGEDPCELPLPALEVITFLLSGDLAQAPHHNMCGILHIRQEIDDIQAELHFVLHNSMNASWKRQHQLNHNVLICASSVPLQESCKLREHCASESQPDRDAVLQAAFAKI